jgi:ribonuclease P protein component
MTDDQRFPRRERVTRTKDLDRVFTEGRRVRGPLMSMCVLANGLPHPRFGIALGRAWRGAVARNRAKRLLREAYRTHKHLFPAGFDVVVVPKPNTALPGTEDIAREIQRLLARLDAEGET